MQDTELINKILLTQRRMTPALSPKQRPFIKEHPIGDKRGLLVVGPRGVGKTTILLVAAQRQNILYVSVDSPLVANRTLTELADAAFIEGFDGVAFDEVHHSSNWSLHCKSIYDSNPKKKIWLSDSSSLVLQRGVGDLSRRFPKLKVPLLSFREYLSLKIENNFDPFDPFSAKLDDFQSVLSTCNVMGLFKEYLREGFRPIFLEGDYKERILGIIEKSIYTDIPFYVHKTQENHMRAMNAIVGFLATAPIPTINIDSMAAQWSMGKEKLYQLLDVMEQVGLVSIIRYSRDFHSSGKGAKIFFTDPSMYAALDGNIGNVREAFVATMFRQAGKAIFACKNEQNGDFEVEKLRLEIGGKSKPSKSADFVIRDDVDLPAGKQIPMWALGMMY